MAYYKVHVCQNTYCHVMRRVTCHTQHAVRIADHVTPCYFGPLEKHISGNAAVLTNLGESKAEIGQLHDLPSGIQGVLT